MLRWCVGSWDSVEPSTPYCKTRESTSLQYAVTCCLQLLGCRVVLAVCKDSMVDFICKSLDILLTASSSFIVVMGFLRYHTSKIVALFPGPCPAFHHFMRLKTPQAWERGYQGYMMWLIFVCGGVFMTNSTPSGVRKHRESTEPESRQTTKLFFFFFSSSA